MFSVSFDAKSTLWMHHDIASVEYLSKINKKNTILTIVLVVPLIQIRLMMQDVLVGYKWMLTVQLSSISHPQSYPMLNRAK